MRNTFDQILDGVITAGAWVFALMLPVLLFQPDTCTISGFPVLTLLLALGLIVYVRANLRDALADGTIVVSDLLARVIAPILLFVAGLFLI
ncbi:MAG: hypothetical protein QNI99_13490 [Woeseiaceae bacterium]|nr:hypothetical protein [Woeseiaceae bacterium]